MWDVNPTFSISFWGFWPFRLLATAYTEHQICMQRAWIISGEVVDVPFGVVDPHISEPQWGISKPPKNFGSNNLMFYKPMQFEKFADFNDTIVKM